MARECEECGSVRNVFNRKYADGKFHQLCWYCRRDKAKEREVKQAAAYRKRKRIMQERGKTCELCGEKTEELDLHHVVRVVDGGSNGDENLLLLCEACHKKQHRGYVR
jgi:5-methylcytosine-specific restriction endonuclease McrA